MYNTEQVNFRVNGTALIGYFDRPPCYFICKLRKKKTTRKKEIQEIKKVHRFEREL